MDHVQLQPAPVSYPPANLPAPGDEVDFSRFVRRVVVDRKKLLIAAIAGAVLALPYDLLRPDLYVAEVVMMAADPVLDGGGGASGDNSYRALIANRTLSRDVLKEFKLSEPPTSLSVDQFIDQHLEVNTVGGSSLLVARFRWPDPNVAAGVLNSLSQKAVNLNRKLNADEATWVRDQIGEQVRQAAEQLTKAERDLIDSKKQNQVELLRRDGDVIVNQRGQLSNLEVQIGALRAKLARAEQELKTRQPLVTMSQSIANDPAMLEAARGSGDTKTTLGLQMRTEEQSGVYIRVDEEIALGRTALAELEGRHRELLRASGGRGNSATMSKLYQSEIEEGHLQQAHELARRVFDETSMRYERARAEAVSNVAQLHVVDAAQVPQKPLPTYRGLYAALAAVFAVFVCFSYLIFKEVGRAAMGLPPPV